MALGQYQGGKALYHLDGNALDSSGNGYNGAPTNISWSGGKVGSGSASFNGTNSLIKLANTSDLKPASGEVITIAMNFKNSTSYAEYGILWNGGYQNGIASNSSGFIALNSSNVIRITGNGTNILDYTFTHNDGKWHNLVCIIRSTGAKIYVDGKLGNSGNITLNSVFSSYEPILGNINYGSGNPIYHFNGSIDELIIDNREWTTTEIKKYYTASKGRFIL